MVRTPPSVSATYSPSNPEAGPAAKARRPGSAKHKTTSRTGKYFFMEKYITKAGHYRKQIDGVLNDGETTPTRVCGDDSCRPWLLDATATSQLRNRLVSSNGLL